MKFEDALKKMMKDLEENYDFCFEDGGDVEFIECAKKHLLPLTRGRNYKAERIKELRAQLSALENE